MNIRFGSWLAVLTLCQSCLFDEIADPNESVANCGPSFAQDNDAVTGFSGPDAFLRTARDFGSRSRALGEGIETALEALKGELGVSEEAIGEAGSLGIAVRTVFAEELHVTLLVHARAAQCAVEGAAVFEASAVCQREAGCTVEAGATQAPFSCRGGCQVEPAAELSCGEDIGAQCTFRGVDVACSGRCLGVCTFESREVVDCPGQCMGMCQGSCSEFGDANGDRKVLAGECIGACIGTCEGLCRSESMTGRACEGSCSGDCVVSGDAIQCGGAVDALCVAAGGFDVTCQRSCAGDFDFPDALFNCVASTTCNAEAKLRALLDVPCTPASVEVSTTLTATLELEQQRRLDLLRGALLRRVPHLLTLAQQALALAKAAEELMASAESADEGILVLLADREGLSAEAIHRLVECAPAAFDEMQTELAGQISLLQSRAAKVVGLQTGLVVVP